MKLPTHYQFFHLAMLVVACGGEIEQPTDTCGTRFRCPADPEPSEGFVADCEKEVKGRCGSQWLRLRQCIYDHEQCKADGTMDSAASGAFCGDATRVYWGCKVRMPDPQPER